MTEDEVKRYAVLHIYIVNLGEGKTTVEVKDKDKLIEDFTVITEILKLNGEGYPCSYLYHKSGGKKRLKKGRKVIVVEQDYIGGKFLKKIEHDIEKDLTDALRNLGIKYDLVLLSQANIKVIEEDSKTLRFIVTDLTTNIKDFVNANKKFIDGILEEIEV